MPDSLSFHTNVKPSIISTKRENETKILISDVIQVVSKIISLGWVFKWVKKLTTIEMKSEDWDIIRIRKDNKGLVEAERKTDKKKERGTKSCNEEFLWKFSSMQDGINYFQSFWYSVFWVETTKLRSIFELDTKNDWIIKFEFDQYIDIWDWAKTPEFLEIEAKDFDTVIKYAKKLWFQESDLKDWWTWKLRKYFSEKVNELIKIKDNYQFLHIISNIVLSQSQKNKSDKKAKK